MGHLGREGVGEHSSACSMRSACAETRAVFSQPVHLRTQIPPGQGVTGALGSTTLSLVSAASQEFRFSSKSLGWAPCRDRVKKYPAEVIPHFHLYI